MLYKDQALLYLTAFIIIYFSIIFL